MISIFVNTWGNYNENGCDNGEWINLPMNEEDLEETLDRIARNMGDNDPEWCIHDYSWNTEVLFTIDENDSIIKVNEMLAEVAELSDDQLDCLAAIIAEGYSFYDALVKMDDVCWYPGMTLLEVAEELAEDMLHGVEEFARRYFDYEAFARDLGFDGYRETEHGVICIW